MNATPRPWKVDTTVIEYGHTGFPVEGPKGHEVCRVPVNFVTTELSAVGNAAHELNATARADAALIVHAVNTLEEAKAALQAVLMGSHCETYYLDKVRAVLTKLEAAS